VTESMLGDPAASGPKLDLHEIQATVLRQRPAPYFGTHVLLRVDDARAGLEFLRRLTPYVDSAAGWMGGTGGRRTAPGLSLISALTAAGPAMTKNLAASSRPSV
jgi:hypothetical protein